MVLLVMTMMLIMVTVVNAIYIKQISEQEFLNLNREQIINDLNIQCDNPYIQNQEIIYPCSINTINKYDNVYWLERISFTPVLSYQIVKYCLENYSPQQCKTFLINNHEQLNVIINEETVIIDTIQYQIINKAVEIILNIEEMQENIIDESLLQLIEQQGGVTIPIIK